MNREFYMLKNSYLFKFVKTEWIIMKKQKKSFIALLVTICYVSLILPSFAQNEEAYKLQGSISFSHPSEFYQSVPFTVLFELTNIGNTVFNGEATLGVRCDDFGFEPWTFQISNLSIGGVYNNSTSYPTDDCAGRYWITVKIQPTEYSSIDLYVGQTLEDQGYRVQFGDSIYVLSQEIFLQQKNAENEKNMMFIAILAIIVSATVAIGIAIYTKKKK